MNLFRSKKYSKHKKKKILFVSKSDQFGGVERVILNIASYLKKRDFICIFASLYEGKFAEIVKKEEYKYFRLKKFSLIKCKYETPAPIYLFKLVSVLGIDLIISNGFEQTIMARFVSKISGIPLISIYHGLSFEQYGAVKCRLYSYLDKLTSGLSDINIAVSNHVASKLKNNGYNPKRLLVIHNGVEIYGRPEDAYGYNRPIVFGYVGRIEEEKGCILFLSAINKLINKDVVNFRAIFYGEGSIRKKLELLIRDKNMGNFIIIEGFENDIKKIYKSFDVLVFPSIIQGEGLPMVLIEAMSFAKAIISTDINAAKEILKRNCAILVQTNNVEALCNAMYELIINNNLYRELSKRALDVASEYFSITAMQEKYAAVIDKILFKIK